MHQCTKMCGKGMPYMVPPEVKDRESYLRAGQITKHLAKRHYNFGSVWWFNYTLRNATMITAMKDKKGIYGK